MGPEKDKPLDESLPADVITQRELAGQLIFQNAEYPHKLSLWERYQNGAQIEPGPLTIVQPYVDLGPFIIPTAERTKRAEQVRQSIRDANLAVDRSISEFDSASRQIVARAWETVQERRRASLEARDWSAFRALVRDSIYAYELTWMLWAANKLVAYRLQRLGTRAFDLACSRASALAAA